MLEKHDFIQLNCPNRWKRFASVYTRTLCIRYADFTQPLTQDDTISGLCPRSYSLTNLVMRYSRFAVPLMFVWNLLKGMINYPLSDGMWCRMKFVSVQILYILTFFSATRYQEEVYLLLTQKWFVHTFYTSLTSSRRYSVMQHMIRLKTHLNIYQNHSEDKLHESEVVD